MLKNSEIIELGGFRKDVAFDIILEEGIYMGDIYCTEYWHDKKPYTGIACEYWESGGIRTIGAYKEGIPAVKCFEFYETGEIEFLQQLLDEGRFIVQQDFYKNGIMKKQTIHEFNVLIMQKESKEDGSVIEDWIITPKNPSYDFLLEQRKLDKNKLRKYFGEIDNYFFVENTNHNIEIPIV